MKKHTIKLALSISLIAALFIGCSPELMHKNAGKSISKGTPGNGSIENSWLMKRKLSNASYFSMTSYYLLDMAYLHSKLYQTLIDSYKECETTCPKIHFRYMECGKKEGGKTLLHRTHNNGLSVDFMVPKMKKGKQVKRYDRLGILHYLLEFDKDGKLETNNNIEIDFETMGKHIIALDNAAKKNGLRVKKVILQIDLKDDFYRTKSGMEVKRRGIYFAKALTPIVDKMHDDHYHVDFVE